MTGITRDQAQELMFCANDIAQCESDFAAAVDCVSDKQLQRYDDLAATAWKRFGALVDSLIAEDEVAEDSPQPTNPAGGVKSTPADGHQVGDEIVDRDGLGWLPASTAIVTKGGNVYQSYGDGHWSGVGRDWEWEQIPLPTRIIYIEGGN